MAPLQKGEENSSKEYQDELKPNGEYRPVRTFRVTPPENTLQEELVCPHDRLRPFPAAKLVPACVWDAVVEHQRRCCGQSGGAGPGMPVSRPFSSWNRPILTEIYLCDACSCQKY